MLTRLHFCQTVSPKTMHLFPGIFSQAPVGGYLVKGSAVQELHQVSSIGWDIRQRWAHKGFDRQHIDQLVSAATQTKLLPVFGDFVGVFQRAM